MRFETHLLDIIHGKKPPGVMGGFLHAASHCYHAAISLRNFGYDYEFFETMKFPFPIVSVGNIVAGGTGKTPFVEYLASQLSSLARTSILTRGYRRRSKSVCLINEQTTVDQCGDEPYLLGQKLSNVRIFVGGNRVFSAHLATLFDTQIAILDDGMQHRRLDRDFEIGMMHASDLFGQNYYLPRGLLRDNPKRLAKADLIVLTGVDNEEHFEHIKSEIKNYISAPVVAMDIQVVNPEEVKDKKVAAFCAIASPDRFLETLKKLGCEVVLHRKKPDHRAFNRSELEELARQGKDLGAQYLVCTEKDMVKISENIVTAIPLIPIKIALSVRFGMEHLDNILQKIHEEIHERRI